MTTRAQREFLKVQLLDTQRLRELAGQHPLMSVALAERERELSGRIAALPLGNKEARTILFFSGEPVQGSMGIDASFAGRVLEPFQSMVMADYADRWHGVVGSRGRRHGEAQSRLLLTGLPRGSFGLELARADSDELFEEGQLADTLAHVTKLVESAGRSDEDFAAQLDETAPRVIQNLREFLEAAAQSPPDLFLVYLYFGDPADDAVANPATSRTEIRQIISDATDDQACFVTTCGLRIVTCLRAEFGKPVIVLTGCGNAPGRATAVEQAGGSALLLLPCDTAECAAAIGICIQRNSNISQ